MVNRLMAQPGAGHDHEHTERGLDRLAAHARAAQGSDISQTTTSHPGFLAAHCDTFSCGG
jgi:hypothetical protein